MNEKEFLQKIKEIKVNVPDEQFFLEYNEVVYNILEENQQLKEQLERSEKVRKEAIEFINDPWILSDYKIGNMLRDYKTKAINILDIDKGE